MTVLLSVYNDSGPAKVAIVGLAVLVALGIVGAFLSWIVDRRRAGRHH